MGKVADPRGELPVPPSIKRLVSRSLERLGYSVVRRQSLDGLRTAHASALERIAELERPVPAAPEREEPEDYQLEMARYHLRSGTRDLDPDFLPLLERCKAFTMTSVERLFCLYKTIEYLVRAEIPGDIVECGVWRGGSMMLAALTLLSLGRSDRRLVLYDTFEGLPKPDADVDVDLFGNRAIDGWLPHRKDDDSSSWAFASLGEVRRNLQATGYPTAQISFEKGMVERTIPQAAPREIALLRLDTDWYASTHHELVHLFPRVSPGGALIVDDYGHFQGARQAVDEYFAALPRPILLHRIDYTGRIGLKI